jgi:hypothetical protein
MSAMARTTYSVFIQKDGGYGVALSQFGAMIRTATDFATESDARAWVEQDQRLEGADNPFRERNPVMPRAH